MISDDERLLVLSFSKEVIRTKTKSLVFNHNILSKNLLEKKGCFVTLQKNKSLRGCIGYITPVLPLFEAVIENSYNAAFCDYRFDPVSRDEVDEISIEISVLTVPTKIIFESSAALIERIVPFRDGVIIKKNGRSATFLPQVWEELPDVDDFLKHLCTKAGLISTQWTDSDIEVSTYQVEILK